MLIRQAEIDGRDLADVRIDGGRVSALGVFQPQPGEPVLDAGGGTLLPGLHDHHIHLMSYAASLESVPCGPPQVQDEAALAAALAALTAPAEGTWIRGVGYHESVAGDIDRRWLDRWVPDTPLRIQHRSGRLWIVNSAGLAALRTAAEQREPQRVPELNLANDGRIYDQDLVMRELLGTTLPPVGLASRRLAAFGVTGITDMTPGNDNDTLRAFARLQADGTLLQNVLLAGSPELMPCADYPALRVGATKVHLHETALPPFDELRQLMVTSHRRRREVAVHCVTEAELVFAVAAFREAGTIAGDRIEHASVTPPALLDDLHALGLTVVTQPNFVSERGDAYRTDIARGEHAWLYRCRSFLERGIALAAGTDAPFGDADPWRAMAAAVARQTASGTTFGAPERLTPEQALALFLGPAEAPAAPRRLSIGMPADLCLLDRPWQAARVALSSDSVRATLRAGELIYDRVDEPPRQSPVRFDPNP